mmetsp:Transcript_9999/g.13597  ORF Transcript_9999/g.13597 Transcript_9999/m.13597 type:complete len:376 (-) Transcript_9999:1226-2353(-)
MQVCLTDLIFVGLLEDVDPVQTLDALLELFVVVQVVVEHVVDVILELLLVVLLLPDLANSLSFFFLHALSLQFHIFDDESQVFVDDGEVLGLVVHLSLLLIEALNDFHARPNARLKLLNFVIEHEFELFELLRLLAVLVDLVLLVFDGTLALKQLIFHRLDVLSLAVRVSDLSFQLLVLRLDFLAQALHLLLLMTILVLDKSELTLHFHAGVDEFGEAALVVLLDLFDFVPSLSLDLLALILVALNHVLDLEGERLFLRLLLLALQDLVAIQVLHQTLVRDVSLTHQVLELLQIFLLLSLQTLVAFLISGAFLSLVLGFLLEGVAVLIHAAVDLLLVAPAHLARLNLDLFHALVALELLLLHFARQVLHLLLVLR